MRFTCTTCWALSSANAYEIMKRNRHYLCCLMLPRMHGVHGVPFRLLLGMRTLILYFFSKYGLACVHAICETHLC